MQVKLETVSGKGYVLQIKELAILQVCNLARHSWRVGLARGDLERIAELDSVLSCDRSNSAEAWGLLALHLCRAAEYEPIEKCESLVARCQSAAEAAISLQPDQPDARVALSSLRPLFGDWVGARSRLLQVLNDYPQHFAARHEMAVLEMSTGRVSIAAPLIAALLQEDPLAATLYYKRGYHLFCLGQFDEMDRVLDNALQTWPKHPGLWQCRIMTLAFTGRVRSALDLLDDDALRPPMPQRALEFHQTALMAIARGDTGISSTTSKTLTEMAGWQSMAVAAIMYLCHLGDVDDAMKICEAYYLRDGGLNIRLRHDPGAEAAINDMHRRATQPLFLPVTASLREHDRFMTLCERIGLQNYWDKAGVLPDFLSDTHLNC